MSDLITADELVDWSAFFAAGCCERGRECMGVETLDGGLVDQAVITYYWITIGEGRSLAHVTVPRGKLQNNS